MVTGVHGQGPDITLGSIKYLGQAWILQKPVPLIVLVVLVIEKPNK